MHGQMSDRSEGFLFSTQQRAASAATILLPGAGRPFFLTELRSVLRHCELVVSGLQVLCWFDALFEMLKRCHQQPQKEPCQVSTQERPERKESCDDNVGDSAVQRIDTCRHMVDQCPIQTARYHLVSKCCLSAVFTCRQRTADSHWPG